MADVTISSLPLGTPSSSALLPYSQEGNTLSVSPSALLQNVGNVGIGGIPGQKLDVTGNIRLGEASVSNYDNKLQFWNANYANEVASIQAAGNYYLSFNTRNASGALAERMRIDNQGDVSIPGKLTNAGVAKAWASFDGLGPIGGNQTIRASHNISNIVRIDGADSNYEVTFPVGVFNNTNYAFIGSSSQSLQYVSILSGPIVSAPTTTKFRFCNISLIYTGQPAGWLAAAAQNIYIAFFNT